MVNRTLKVPLQFVKDEEWRQLRVLAYKAAAFGNRLLSEQYAKAKGVAEFATYRDSADELSSYVRDAMNRQVVGTWRREGKKILRGEETLGKFHVRKSLMARERGVKTEPSGDQRFVRVRFEPTPAKPHTFEVYRVALKKDWYLKSTLDRIAAKQYKLTRVTLFFERGSRKLFLLINYQKPTEEQEPGENRARVQLDDAGLLYVACNGQALQLGDEQHRLEHLKEHHEKIRDRLKRCLGKRKRRHKHRQTLSKFSTFDEAAQPLLHKMSKGIVGWCKVRNVGLIEWRVKADGTWPEHDLRAKVEYKADEAGITFSQESPPELNGRGVIERRSG